MYALQVFHEYYEFFQNLIKAMLKKSKEEKHHLFMRNTVERRFLDRCKKPLKLAAYYKQYLVVGLFAREARKM